MKGRKLILIICVIALCFAGVGYSAWTEGLNIKSMFATGDIDVVFENPVIVSSELDEVYADADEGIMEIYGTVAPGSTVLVEYDIYNGSSIPVKYQPGDEDLPEGITLDQNDSLLEPGGYHRGNQLTLEPGEDEVVLSFVQYNSSDKGGWKEELEIRWNITEAEEVVEAELSMTTAGAIIEEAPIEEAPATDTMPEDDSTTDTGSRDHDSANNPVTEPDVPETESPVTETIPEVEPTPDTDPINPDPANEPAVETPSEDTPAVNTPLEAPAGNDNNKASEESGTQTESGSDNAANDNTGSDEGSEENVTNGEE